MNVSRITDMNSITVIFDYNSGRKDVSTLVIRTVVIINFSICKSGVYCVTIIQFSGSVPVVCITRTVDKQNIKYS